LEFVFISFPSSEGLGVGRRGNENIEQENPILSSLVSFDQIFLKFDSKSLRFSLHPKEYTRFRLITQDFFVEISYLI